MKGLYTLDENKIPMKCTDSDLFGQFFSDEKNFVLVKSEIGNFRLSSVFLGIDGKFETTVFQNEKILESKRQDSFPECVRVHNQLRERILQTYVK